MSLFCLSTSAFFASRSATARSYNRAFSILSAVALFLNWLRSFWHCTTMLVGRCVIRTAVDVLSADLDLRRFDAGYLSLEQVEHLDLEAVALRPPGIHPHQHFGPVLGFRAARARVDGEQRVARVVGAAQHVLQLEDR